MARVRIANGLTLDYLEAGNRHGPAVLFVHGYLDSWRVWESSLPFLPQQCRLVFVTQRGFGDSDKPDSGYRQIDFVEDIKSFMEAVGLDHGHEGGKRRLFRKTLCHDDRRRPGRSRAPPA